MDIAGQLTRAALLIAKDDIFANDTDTLDFPIVSNDTDWTGGEIINNGSVISPVDVPIVNEGSYILNTIIGLLIVLVASLLNALGLNLTKLDHIRQQSIPRRERRLGSPLALRYLRPDWVAPLGSSSLIFNFLFAHWLVGTPVTATDINGTAVIVFGVILILIFSSINHGLSQTIDIPTLNGLWTRASWLAYFAFLVLFTGSTFFVSHLLASLLASRASYSPLAAPPAQKSFWRRFTVLERRALTHLENLFKRTDDARITWLQGIGWAVCGGSLAGMCLVFTKVVVKLFANGSMVSPSPILTLLLVILTAILQIVCLNRALECTDTVVVVPLFYAGYTVFGFINSLIFFDQSKQYAPWVLFTVFISIGVLISGVVLLSLKSSAKAASDPYTAPEIHLRPQMPRAPAPQDGPKPDEPDVMWEVGSDSDDDDVRKDVREDIHKDGGGAGRGRGVGSETGQGERRGLLGEEEEV